MQKIIVETRQTKPRPEEKEAVQQENVKTSRCRQSQDTVLSLKQARKQKKQSDRLLEGMGAEYHGEDEQGTLRVQRCSLRRSCAVFALWM